MHERLDVAAVALPLIVLHWDQHELDQVRVEDALQVIYLQINHSQLLLSLDLDKELQAEAHHEIRTQVHRLEVVQFLEHRRFEINEEILEKESGKVE